MQSGWQHAALQSMAWRISMKLGPPYTECTEVLLLTFFASNKAYACAAAVAVMYQPHFLCCGMSQETVWSCLLA